MICLFVLLTVDIFFIYLPEGEDDGQDNDNFTKGKADVVRVHHGHFWKSGNPSLMDWVKERVGLPGDTIEIYLTAKDARFNVIFAAHHATETVGMKALSIFVRRIFKVETIFADILTGL